MNWWAIIRVLRLDAGVLLLVASALALLDRFDLAQWPLWTGVALLVIAAICDLLFLF